MGKNKLNFTEKTIFLKLQLSYLSIELQKQIMGYKFGGRNQVMLEFESGIELILMVDNKELTTDFINNLLND